MPSPSGSSEKLGGGSSGNTKRSPPAKMSRKVDTTEAQGEGGPGKKQKRMASLSSFQATLNFKPAPSNSTGAASTNGASTSTQNRDWGRTKSQDARAMPPPSTTSWKSSKSTSTLSTTPGGVGISAKGKEREVVELFDDDEDVVMLSEEGHGNSWNDLSGSSQYDMWTERYSPTAEVDLAPGKAKIAKLRGWIHESLYGCSEEHASSSIPASARDKVRKYKRILLLTGPAGIGKTTTVKVLARELGVELIEWSESVEERSLGSHGFDRESGIAKLQAFLSRHSYAPLAMLSAPISPAQRSTSSQSSSGTPRLLLLTSLPNISHQPTREAFHAALRDFCKTYTSSSCPLVIVHSDAGSGGRAEESWMDRDRGGREGALELLGREVKDGPWLQEIEFIPLAPTFLTKALKRVLSLAEADGASGLPPSAVQLVAISANGDLRSAINSLQLLCGRSSTSSRNGRHSLDLGNSKSSKKKVTGKGSRGGKGAKLDVSSELRTILDAITRREQSLGLFHALGKVFYNKRLGDPGEDDENGEVLALIRALPQDEPLPNHLKDFERHKPLIQLESFIPTIPVDASSFALWLHQSLPSFCSEVDQAAEAIDNLCAADIMRTDDDIWQSSQQAISYALNIAIRGTQMSLPSPVPRKHQKILKPEFFDRYKAERDNAGLLDVAAGYVAKKAVASSGVLSEYDLNAFNAEGSPWGGMLSKHTLASEVIPMMIKLQTMSRNPLLPLSLAGLRLAPYSAGINGYQEVLEATSREVDGEDVEEGMAGEDGLGEVPLGGGWDQEDQVQEEEKEFLEDDDIQDWD